MGDGNQRKQGGANESEGSRTADERFPPAAAGCPHGTDPEKRIEPEQDVENYRDEYERGEEAGRSHRAGDPEANVEGVD
jgi:hypothetical protein